MLDIKWSKPYKVREGSSTKWRREWCIPDEMVSAFFSFWKKNRFKLLADGFSVSKTTLTKKWNLYDTKRDIALFKSFGTSSEQSKKIVSKKDPNIDFQLSPYEITIKDGLKPWQVEAAGDVISAIKKWGAAVDGSELGTGKTFCACGIARELKIPFVIVCPKPVIHQWKTVISDHFKISDKCKGIINYELLIRGRKDSSIASFVLDRKTKRNKFTWKLPKNTLIIWDEAHRLKNFKTISSKVCLLANKDGYNQLFLSATLAASPLDLRTIGLCTKIFGKSAKEYYDWAYEHGVFKGDWGLEFNNAPEQLKKIHHYLFKQRGVRLLRDVIPYFPDTEIIVNAYNMDDESTAKLRSIYDDMKRELKVLDLKGENDESEMAIRIRALQKAELLKIPLFEEMIKEGLSCGMSVAVFLNFSDSIDALAKRMNTNCIYDGRNEKIRLKHIEDFQSGKETLIILNLAAAREGLNMGDEDGNHPRLTLISPNDSVTKIKQVLGRVHRSNSKSKSIQKIIYVADTQEQKVVENVGIKLTNLTLINNGEITDKDLKI